jgi:hypothetical protein
MTILRPETTILAAALCDLPNADAAVQKRLGADLVRALRLATPDKDYADDMAAGYVEDLDAWAARVALTPRVTSPTTIRRTGGTA